MSESKPSSKDRCKIIAVDNFDRDSVSDVLVADNVAPQYADEIVRALNSTQTVNGAKFFRIVPLYHELYVFQP